MKINLAYVPVNKICGTALFWAVVVSGCRPQPPASQTKLITNQKYACEQWDEARLTAVRSAIGPGFITGFDASHTLAVEQAVAGLNNAYIDYLLHVPPAPSGKRFSIRIVNSGDSGYFHEEMGQMGATPLPHDSPKTSDPNERDFLYIMTSEPREVIMSQRSTVLTGDTLHELGHANMSFVARRTKDREAFLSELTQLSRAEMSNPNVSRYLTAYHAGTIEHRVEFFAEAFSSYYCSKESQAAFFETFPNTFAFFEEVFLPAVWAGGGESEIKGSANNAGPGSGSSVATKPNGPANGSSGPTGAATGPVASTPPPNNTAPPKASLKFALAKNEDPAGGFKFFVSADISLKKSSYCLGSSRACSADAAEWMVMNKGTGKGSKVAYVSSGTVLVKENFCITVGGQSTDSSRWSFRTIMLKKTEGKSSVKPSGNTIVPSTCSN